MQTKEILAAQKFLAHYGYVKRCALTAAPLPRFAEDIAQQVFVEFISRLDQWDLDGDIRPILAKTTYFVAKKYWREHLKTLPPMLAKVAESLRVGEEDTAMPNSCENDTTVLWQCIDLLPKKSQNLIRSYYFDQIKTDQLAKKMNLRVESVNRAICRIREKLRLCIKQRTDQELKHDR